MQLPSPPIPATTPSNSHRFRSPVSGPNRSGSSRAIGLAPIATTSRTIPPTPVAAPWYGSTADGCECDSILNTTASPSPTSTAPASWPGPTSTADPSVGSRRRCTFEDLYEQCSDHIAAYIASSSRVGSRPSVETIARSSSSVRPSARCGASALATRSDPREGRREEGGEHRLPARGPDVRVNGVLGMRHQTDHVPRLVPNPGDRVGRTVGVRVVVERTVGGAVAEHDEPLALDPRQVVPRRHELSLAVLHRDGQHLTRNEIGGERRERRLDPDVDDAAHEPEGAVADQRAGKETCLAEDLEAVADPDHRPAALGEGTHLVHHRREPGDRAGPEVVAVREPAGQDHGVDLAEVGLGVPQRNALAAHRFDRSEGIAVVERTGERDDANAGLARTHARTSPLPPTSSITSRTSNRSITGFESRRSAISWTCDVAELRSAASSSSSTAFPIRTFRTFVQPSAGNEPSTALPCGSSRPGFRKTSTSARNLTASRPSGARSSRTTRRRSAPRLRRTSG